MSIRRATRQAKSRGKWDYSLGNKKGAKPRQAAPFKDSCAIFEPSRRSLGNPSA